MRINEIIKERLRKIYEGNEELLKSISSILKPELTGIVDNFYDELLDIPEIRPILMNSIVQKNLKASQKKWIYDFIQPTRDIDLIIERQKRIGTVHANINVNLNYFALGISIMKREIYSRLHDALKTSADFSRAFLVLGELFDVLVSIISESYFSNEMIHETNELSLKMKGMSQNTAVECERLRSMLLDWLRNSLTLLYHPEDLPLNALPKLKNSNFGLWVTYKGDLLSHTVNISSDLKEYIHEIDNLFLHAAKSKSENNITELNIKVTELNEIISKVSWIIAGLVDQFLEIDKGTDPLTRLFNRRYLETILRRQTEISMKQGLPYSILMIDLDHFKNVNDTYGHESGDAVLKEFSELLLASVRSSDFIFRYGGEEFLLALGNVDSKEAMLISEKIRLKCQKYIFRLQNGREINKTCSIGVASFSGHPDYNRIIKLADEALYEAKNEGRNRVVLKTE